MKKNYFLHTAILLVALVCGTVPVWSQTYKKISSIDELTDGKYVIAYGEEYAMTNENAGKSQQQLMEKVSKMGIFM